MAPSDVVVCTWCGAHEGVEEALTLGRRVAASLGGALRWLVLGELPAQDLGTLAARHGVGAVERIVSPALDDFRPDAFVEALARACAEISPKLVLMSQTFDARLVAPRLAARLGAAVVTQGVDVEADAAGSLRIHASAYGGDTRVVYELTGAPACVVTLIANAVAPEPAQVPSSPPVRERVLDLSGVQERIRVVEKARREGPRLEEAEIIVAGGRGLGAPENYKLVEQLAEALGGMAGASRPIVDEGWVDPARQVGLTGRITRPALYLAAGISGASQHMAGCSAAGTIAAVNKDPDAAIFRYARYGIVGDCLEILPELIRAAKQR